MPLPHAESSPGGLRRAVRWLLPAALLALTPKCLLCLMAYVGMGTALGLGGPEWCRVTDDSPMSWVTMFAWLGAAGVFVRVGIKATSLFSWVDKKASR